VGIPPEVEHDSQRVLNYGLEPQKSEEASSAAESFCVFTETENGLDHFEVCQLVFSLRDGQISLQGTFDQTVNPNRFAVVGGTGIYRDARGQVVADFSKEFLFHFELTG
jgi:hypothetical protein